MRNPDPVWGRMTTAKSSLRVRYQTIEFGKLDIHLRTLRDLQEFEDEHDQAGQLGISSAAWPLFGVLWTAGEVLARLMFERDVEGLRILEVGCGIGLTSLVLNSRDADITATDHHPEAGAFLRHNTALNGGRRVPFVRTGWADLDCGMGMFDLIVGSDVLYERGHAELLAAFIDRHAGKSCEVVIVDPGRGNHAQFSREMVGLDFEQAETINLDREYVTGPFRGRVLGYHR